MGRRRGVTILVTLGVIAAMLSLVGILFGYLAQARSAASREGAYLQSALLKGELERFLAGQMEGNVSKETRQLFYSSVLAFSTPQGDFSSTLSCRPLADRIPLAWLGAGEKDPRSRLAKRLFDKVAEEAEIVDPELLYEMALQGLKGERFKGGRIGWLRGPKGEMGGADWSNLLDAYLFRSGDLHAVKAPWDRFFLLRPLAKPIKGLEKDFLAPETVTFLFDLDSATVRSEYRTGDLEGFLREMGEESKRYAWLWKRGASVEASCEGTLLFRESVYNISFDYRMKRIENFEIEEAE